MPWEVHAWQKLISLPRLTPVHSSHLYMIWFSFAHSHALTSSCPLPQHFLKSAPYQKFTSHYLSCSSVPLSPPPTTPYVPHLFPAEQSLVSEIWQLKWPPPPWPPVQSQQKSVTAVGVLCSPRELDPHLRMRVKACPHSQPWSTPSPDPVGFGGHGGLLLFGYGALRQCLASDWDRCVLSEQR